MYGYNRFHACRFGFEAMLADPGAHTHIRLREDVMATLYRIQRIGDELGTADALRAIGDRADRELNDSRWLRERFQETRNLSDVVRLQAERWAHGPGARGEGGAGGGEAQGGEVTRASSRRARATSDCATT